MSILAYALAHGVAAHAGLFEPRALPIAPLANTSCSTSLDNDLATLFADPSDRLKAQRDGCAAALALTREEQAAVAAEVKSITVRPSPLRYELPCLQGECSAVYLSLIRRAYHHARRLRPDLVHSSHAQNGTPSRRRPRCTSRTRSLLRATASAGSAASSPCRRRSA